MDHFQVVLGMEFLRQAKTLLMPSINYVCIMEEKSPCIIPAVQVEPTDEVLK